MMQVDLSNRFMNEDMDKRFGIPIMDNGEN
jgi:hypothetical protein